MRFCNRNRETTYLVGLTYSHFHFLANTGHSLTFGINEGTLNGHHLRLLLMILQAAEHIYLFEVTILVRSSNNYARRAIVTSREMYLWEVREPYITIDATIEGKVCRQRCYRFVIGISHHDFQQIGLTKLHTVSDIKSKASISTTMITHLATINPECSLLIGAFKIKEHSLLTLRSRNHY